MRTLFLFSAILLSAAALLGAPARSRTKALPVAVRKYDAAAGKIVAERMALNPEKTAIIVIDMWNFHWCMTASERVSAMAPRMNRALSIARALGMQVIWNPSDVVTAYSGYPQYERAIAVACRAVPQERPPLAAQFTAPAGACMCGAGLHCCGNYGWDAMHPDLAIGSNDLIASSTDEIYALLADRSITDIIYMGVHTNMCVFGKPGAMSSMWSAGFRCLLADDLNDAFTAYDPDKSYTPDRGTTEIGENLLKAGVQSINMGENFRSAGLWKPDTPVDYVRFTPWGQPQRPYFIETSTVVTLTAPWLEHAQIRYTIDGSAPSPRSSLYTAPLEISKTLTIRAAAFRKGKQMSLASMAHYVRLPSPPPLPDVYIDDLPYIPNKYTQAVSTCLWYPEKWKSFEKKPLRVRGKTYAHGMGFRAPSSVQYELKPEYKRFVALAGVDENMVDENYARFIGMQSSVVFCVYVDGVKMAESPVMRLSQEPWRFDVSIPKGSRLINISCMDAGSRSLLDYGNWLNAGFTTGEAG